MKALSIFSILGIIMLVGLVGKNAILLVDRTNQMKEEKGLSTYDALVEAGETRLRPILMTTVAMVFGMLPIAISTEAGSEWKTGLAWAIVGGLISSLLLTLVLVPVVYTKVDDWKVRVPLFFRRLAAKWRTRSGEVLHPVDEQEPAVTVTEVGHVLTAVNSNGNGTK